MENNLDRFSAKNKVLINTEGAVRPVKQDVVVTTEADITVAHVITHVQAGYCRY